MSIRDVHVILGVDNSAQIAVELAVRFEAHLTGLSIGEPAELTDYMDEARAAIWNGVRAASIRFNDLLSRRLGRAETIEIQIADDHNMEPVIDLCRLTDLIVVGQPSAADRFQKYLLRRLLFDSSAPILVVPATSLTAKFQTALVAWDGRPVAAHALKFALPLLALAEAVHVVTIGRAGADAPDGASRLIDHLGHHGIAATWRELEAVGSISDSLLDYVSLEGVDWITMGAFGRGRFHERIFGSSTQDMMTRSTVPVLMHH